MLGARIFVDWENRELRIRDVEADPGRIVWSLIINRYCGVFGAEKMAFMLADTQEVEARIRAVDARGNDARLDGIPQWSSSNEEILLVDADADGMGALIAAVGPLGTAQVQVRVDADLGEGTRELTGILDVEVVAGEAVAIEIVPGQPTTHGG